MASTEPRHRGRGSLGGRTTGARGVGASTEPRHRGRGSRAGAGGGRPWLMRFNGAPASRPGIDRDLAGEVIEVLASTEPRHRGRGSTGLPAARSVFGGLQRSPGIAAGDRWCAGRATRRALGFNGAPASRPGIGVIDDLARRGRERFNGAPASRPGIDGGTRRVSPLQGASTEPRHRGRGSYDSAAALTSRIGFNGAPASRPGIDRPAGRRNGQPEPLQRSPGIAAGDRSEPRPLALRACAASTEPRHRGRGSDHAFGAITGEVWLQRSPGIAAGDRAPRKSGALAAV